MKRGLAVDLMTTEALLAKLYGDLLNLEPERSAALGASYRRVLLERAQRIVVELRRRDAQGTLFR